MGPAQSVQKRRLHVVGPATRERDGGPARVHLDRSRAGRAPQQGAERRTKVCLERQHNPCQLWQDLWGFPCPGASQEWWTRTPLLSSDPRSRRRMQFPMSGMVAGSTKRTICRPAKHIQNRFARRYAAALWNGSRAGESLSGRLSRELPFLPAGRDVAGLFASTLASSRVSLRRQHNVTRPTIPSTNGARRYRMVVMTRRRNNTVVSSSLPAVEYDRTDVVVPAK